MRSMGLESGVLHVFVDVCDNVETTPVNTVRRDSSVCVCEVMFCHKDTAG